MNQNHINWEVRQGPYWLEDGRINELKFLESMRQISHFRTVCGVFYDQGEHRVEDGAMKSMIVDELSRGISQGLNKRAKDLLELMRYRWDTATRDTDEEKIHVLNGTILSSTGAFLEEKEFSTRRLRACYEEDPGKPERFLQYLNELLEPEDIPTLQEFLGYCLIPSTRGQKMLVISGKGGEGKSVLGEIMGHIWGDSLIFSSVQKIATDRFARATLMQRLVMIDDDMSMEALSQTHLLKTLVTLQGKTDVEMKGVQSFQTELYARFLGFSNGSLSALYDRSYGFYRRLILLKTKDRPADRVDYPYLGKAIVDCERNQIFRWCLEGLVRLINNTTDLPSPVVPEKICRRPCTMLNRFWIFWNSPDILSMTKKGM